MERGEVEKIFEDWNRKKIALHLSGERKFPQQGEIWICDMGVNIGSEQNNLRPVLVVNKPKKGERTCTIIPASNTKRTFSISVEGFNFLPHQIRTVDTKRFKRYVYRISKEEVKMVMKMFFDFLG